MTNTVLLQALLLTLTFLAVVLVSGNNLSACVGPAIGSEILSKRAGILLGATGFSLGLLIQGPSMITSIHVLFPNSTAQLQSEVLLAAILVFVVAAIIRAPVSLSMSLVGLFAGLSTANTTFRINPLLLEVVAMWFAAPAIAIVSAFYLIRIVNKSGSKNIWRKAQTFKLVLILLAFSTSYVLGANTLGLIVAIGGFNILTLITAIGAIFVGTFLLSGGEIRRVSQELFLMRYPNATVTLLTSTILVELATIFNIPLSNTQTLSAALVGTGISYKTKFISLKPFVIIVAGWIIAPLLGFVIGLII